MLGERERLRRSEREPGSVNSESSVRYESSDDNMARLIVYFGPYLFWGTLGALVGGLVLLMP